MEVRSEKPDVRETRRPPTVVRIRRRNGRVVQGCDIYIGRRVDRGGWNLPTSKWHNPYRDRDRGVACEKFKHYLYHGKGKALLNYLHELEGKVLGCWCGDGLCHGNILLSAFALKFCPNQSRVHK